jgi:hypothetical protein
MRETFNKMWVIFRDPMTIFNHLDKYIVEVIGDEDIHTYQEFMYKSISGRKHEFYSDVYYLQPFFTSKDDVNYFARRYKTWVFQ